MGFDSKVKLGNSGSLALVGAFCAFGAIWVWWPGAFTHIASDNFLPHGVCYLWNRQLLTLHVVSDSVIFLSYLAIAASLGWLVYREMRKIPFVWVFIAFGVFIVACGFTHAMDVIVLCKPFYWLAGDIKLVTAAASLVTAVSFPYLVPRIGHLLDAAKSSEQNERRFQAAIEGCNDAFYILKSVRDTAGEIIDFSFAYVNDRGALLISGTPQELTGQSLCNLLPVVRTDGIFERYKQVVETGESFEDEFRFNHVDTIQADWLDLRVRKLDDGVAIMTTNISARKETELELVRNATFTRWIIASSPFATVVTNLNGMITAVNPAAERLLSYTKEGLIEKETPLLLLDPREVSARASALSEELETPVEPGMDVLTAKPERGMVEQAEWKLVRGDGSRFDAQVTVSALTDTSGDVVGLMLIAYDITERKRTEEYLSYVAQHDDLTDLPTRSLFRDRLLVAIARASKIALLMVDVDHFKRINDTMGHQIGDELLVEVAKRLQGSVRRSDTVARIGGDEFVLVLDDLHSVREAEIIAEKLVRALQPPILLGEQTLSITVSVGVCLYPEHGENEESLLKNADLALYRTKDSGRNGFQIFTAEMALASSRPPQIEAGV